MLGIGSICKTMIFLSGDCCGEKDMTSLDFGDESFLDVLGATCWRCLMLYIVACRLLMEIVFEHFSHALVAQPPRIRRRNQRFYNDNEQTDYFTNRSPSKQSKAAPTSVS